MNTIIPKQVLFGNPEKTALKISLDGSKLSFLAPVNDVLNVFVADVDNPNEATQVTNDTNRGIRSYGWCYNKDFLFYLQDEGGDEDWHVYVTNLKTKKVVNVTPFKKSCARIVSVSHKHENKIIIACNKRIKEFFDLYELDLTTLELKLHYKNEKEFSNFLLDNDYRIRFAEKSDPDGGRTIYQMDLDLKETKFLKVKYEDSLGTFLICLNKSQDTLYYCDSSQTNTSALYSYDLHSKKKKLIFNDKKSDISNFIADRKLEKLRAVITDYFKPEVHILDESLKEDWTFLQKELNSTFFDIVSQDLNDSTWIICLFQDNYPASYYIFDKANKTLKFLFNVKPKLEKFSSELVKMHPVIIKSRDGLDMVSYLSLPKECTEDSNTFDKNISKKIKKQVPLILSVHGGPNSRDSWGLRPDVQWLTNRGYAVLQVNYRGSTGFGKDFVSKASGEWGAKMHDDLIDAVNWAIENNITTKDQVAIFGGSYGGYSTLVGLTFTPEVFACGVDIVGPSNLVTVMRSIPPYWKPFYERFKLMIGGDPETEEGRKFLDSRSPFHFADKITKPLLIAQGANDPRVKQAESDMMVDAMKKHKIPVTYVLYPDEGHGFAKPENRIAFYAIAEKFLAKILKGKSEEIKDELKNSSAQILEGEDFLEGEKI